MEEAKNKEFEIRFRDLVSVFVRCWWILLLVGALVCGGLYGFLRATRVPKYTATAKVYVIRIKGDGESLDASQVSISNALVDDFKESVTMGDVLTMTREELGMMNSISDKTLRSMVKVESAKESRLITISVTAGSMKDAVDLGDSLARNSVRYFNENMVKADYSQYVDKLDTGHPESCATVANPISFLKIFLIALVAVILVYLVFFILYVTNDKINSAEDLNKYLEVNLLGQIPHQRTPREKSAGTEKGDKA